MFSTKRARKGNDIACVFVHAGAGYHSVANEGSHLEACNDAAKAAMAILRNGGSALDAVEIAVKVLEDREITNAGYGSNLAVDGVVECDAVVVDHHGRSGGVGAVAQIRNPVSLARLLLDHTSQALTLRRVPPNLLVGQGATDFASEHSMPVMPFECMVSPNARERWRRWREDLTRAERNRQMEEDRRYGLSPPPSQPDNDPYDQIAANSDARKAHTARMMLQNEGQPISPPPSDDPDRLPITPLSPGAASSASAYDHEDSISNTDIEYMDPEGPSGLLSSMSRNPFANSTQKMPSAHSADHLRSHMGSDGGLMASRWADLPDVALQSDDEPFTSTSHVREREEGSSSEDSATTTIELKTPHKAAERQRAQSNFGDDNDAAAYPLPITPPGTKEESPTPNASTPLEHVKNAPPLPPDHGLTRDGQIKGDDVITDTVGAIAIDMYGNIAAAASSGGIGMKHRGRIGPAALVGVGATVIPADSDDLEQTTVATVTSGTGEHMGTTMAAKTCSDRVYEGLRKVAGGKYEECSDDEAVTSFIKRDFMSHASVQNSNSSGAIGILSVKKTKDGAWLYFAHNTDSFALASFHSDEAKPVCTMSRSKGNGVTAQGGRGIRFGPRRRKT